MSLNKDNLRFLLCELLSPVNEVRLRAESHLNELKSANARVLIIILVDIVCEDVKNDPPSECTLSPAQQIDLVAEFHVNRIRPSRIAYRLGIDLAQVEAWLSGEEDSYHFQDLIRRHRRRKYQMQLRRAAQFSGQQSYEMRLAAERDLAQQFSQ